MKKRRISSILTTCALSILLIFTFAATASAVNYGFFTKDEISEDSYAYSFAIVGDTQSLVYSDAVNADTDGYTPRLARIYDWIIDNRDSKKIEAVIGLGDITETWNEAEYPEQFSAEWEIAVKEISKLDKAGIPYTLVRGNHDIENGYNNYIGGMQSYVNSFTGADGSGEFMYTDSLGRPTKFDTAYKKLTIGENKWLIVMLDWETTEAELDWAAEVIRNNPDYGVIVTMHDYLYHDMTVESKGDCADTARPNPNWDPATDPLADNDDDLVYNPDGIYKRLISKHENIKMVISGHVTNFNVQRSQIIGDNGNTITQLLVDPQGMDLDSNNAGGCGMVCMIYFNADGTLAENWNGKDVTVEWYSTIKDQYYRDDNQFTLDLDLYRDGIETENYGIIPKAYADAEKYPFVTFGYDSDIDEYFFHGAYTSWSASDGAYPSLSRFSGAAKKAEAFILLRRDYVFDEGVSYQMGKLTLTANLDLNGHTITTTKDNKPFFATNTATNSKSTLNVYGKEGSTFLNGSDWRAFITMGCDKGGNGSRFTFNFNGITFGYADGGTSQKLIAETFSMTAGASGAEIGEQYLNFTDCTFDLSGKPSDKAVSLFVLNETVGNANNTQCAHVRINGGNIIDSDFDKVELYSANSSDSFAFGKSEGKYTALSLTSENSSLGDVYAGEGEAYVSFGEASHENGKYVYQLKETNVEITPYGMINKDDYPVASYPFALFRNGELQKAYTSYFAFLKDASSITSASVLFLRDNYTTGTAEDDALKSESSGVDRYLYNLKAHLTIDLGGKTLTRGDKHLLQIFANGKSYSITVKNSTLNATGGTIIPINDTGSKTGATVTLTFDGVTFESGKSRQYPFVDAYTGGAGECVNITFNDCVFNISGNTASGVVLFDLKDDQDKFDINLTFNGGNLIADANSLAKTTFATYNNDDSVTFGTDKMTLTLPKAAHPDFTVLTNENSILAPLYPRASGSDIIYTFNDATYKDDTIAEYGTIPKNYPKERYPFALFDKNGFNKAYCTWYHLLQDIGGDADFGADADTVIYLRRNYSTDECNASSQGLYSINGNAILDLGGNTFTRGAYHMFQAYGKSTSSTGTSTKLTVKNGYILNGGNSAIIVFNNASTVGARASFRFEFENVIFGIAEGATHSSLLIETFTGGAHGSDSEVIFNGCVIDLCENEKLGTVAPTKNITLFNLLESTGNKNFTTVIFRGGEIKANTLSGVTVYKLNDPTDIGKDSVSFEKAVGGNYTSLELPMGTEAPEIELPSNSGALVFVKIADRDNKVTYRLRPAKVSAIDFTPKMSITLDESLIVNVYIPAELLLKFTFDGVEYADLSQIEATKTKIGGKNYYKISVPLHASEAARELELIASVKVDEASASAKFTFSIPKYAAELIASGSEIESQLMKNVLSYVRAAYIYFDTDTPEVLEKINSIIGEDYDEKNPPEASGSTDTPTVGLIGASFNLTATPAIRFYINGEFNADSYSFFIGEKELAKKTGSDTVGNYIELDVYAYEMSKTVIYRINGTESGSYHIASYLEWAKGEGDALLVSLIERFVGYSESADAYRKAFKEA